MSLTRAVAKNAGIQYLSRVIGTALGVATLAVLTRYLGDAGFGRYTVAASYLQFVGTLIDFGLNITATAMLSEPGADQRKILSNLFTLRLVSAVIFFGSAIGISFLFPWGSDIQLAIAVGSLSFIFLSIHQVILGLFQKSLKMAYPAITEVLGRATLFLATLAVAQKGGGLAWIMAAMGLANLVMIIGTIFFARRIERFGFALDRGTIAKILRRSWPIGLSTIFNLIYLRGDIIVMKFAGRPDAEIGWYGAAYKPLDVITVIPIIFMGLVLPLFVQAWQSGERERIERIVRRAVDAVSLLAFPTLAGGIALATPIMTLISGPDFAPAGPLFALLVIAAFTVFYGSLFGHLIVGVGRQRTMLFVYAADAALSLSLYLLFIPRYGAAAAALITILSEAIIAVAAGLIVARETKIKIIFHTTGKAFLAAGFMGWVIYSLGNIGVLWRIVIGAAVYFVLLAAMRAFKKDEISLLLKGT